MQEDLRKLKKQSGNASDSDSDSDIGRKGPSLLEQELKKYSKQKGLAAKQKQSNRKGRKDEEDDLLEAMSRFSKRVKTEGDEGDIEREEEERLEEERLARKAEQEQLDPEKRSEIEHVKDVEGEVDDDVGWMRHSLKFQVDDKELTRRAEEEYSVSPRDYIRDEANYGTGDRSKSKSESYPGKGRIAAGQEEKEGGSH